MVVPDIVTHENRPLPKDPDWWRGAVIYQIYPRSFQDSNGDGVGDLAGIIHRLPYVAGLGVDAIWISPFFPSPMLDFGYDVMNYRDVDPMFGTLADFDALIAAGARAGPAGDDRPGAQPHQRPAPLVPREPVEPGQSQGRLVRLGGREAGRDGAQQLAVDLRRGGLGVGQRAAAVLPAQLPQGAAGPELPQRRRCRRSCWRWRASGWSGGWTGSGSTRSTSTSATASSATTRCCRWICGTIPPRRR